MLLALRHFSLRVCVCEHFCCSRSTFSPEAVIFPFFTSYVTESSCLPRRQESNWLRCPNLPWWRWNYVAAIWNVVQQLTSMQLTHFVLFWLETGKKKALVLNFTFTVTVNTNNMSPPCSLECHGEAEKKRERVSCDWWFYPLWFWDSCTLWQI